MSSKLKKNRSELYDKKKQLVLSETGKELLSDRLGALVEAFSNNMRKAYRKRKELTEIASVCAKSISRSMAIDRERLALASIAPNRKLAVNIRQENIMGIIVPKIELVANEYDEDQDVSLLSSSEQIEEVDVLFTNQIAMLIDLAVQEQFLDRIGQAIKKTRYRYNALEQTVIPALRKEIKEIEFSMDSLESEEQFKKFIFIEEDKIC